MRSFSISSMARARHLARSSFGSAVIGGLVVGASVGKGIALANGLPFVAVNHLEAHALTATLPGVASPPVEFPYLLLLLSGGHCQCVAVEAVGRYQRLGTTLDDAVGEAIHIPDLDLPADVRVVDEQLELRHKGVGEIPSEGSHQN